MYIMGHIVAIKFVIRANKGTEVYVNIIQEILISSSYFCLSGVRGSQNPIKGVGHCGQ